jgi:hypothetical protein
MTHPVKTTPSTDLFGAGFQADPHGVYARLRAAGSVHRVALPDGSAAWLVAQGFTPRHAEGLRSRIQGAVSALADRLAARVREEGRADVVEEFARPLPLKVSDLLAVPEPERERFAGWVATMLAPGSWRSGTGSTTASGRPWPVCSSLSPSRLWSSGFLGSNSLSRQGSCPGPRPSGSTRCGSCR